MKKLGIYSMGDPKEFMYIGMHSQVEYDEHMAVLLIGLFESPIKNAHLLVQRIEFCHYIIAWIKDKIRFPPKWAYRKPEKCNFYRDIEEIESYIKECKL